MDDIAKTGRMVSTNELENSLMQARSWFEAWRSKEDFVRQVDSLSSQVPSDQYWGRGSTKWLREAWSLARYCEASKPTHVRLQTPDPPDAYVRSAGKEIPIEITFGLDPERRIGDEYKPKAARLTHHDADEDRLSTVCKVLEVRIREKTTKTYPAGTILLIDLNMSDRVTGHAHTETTIREILAETHHSFSAVRVLWRNRIY